MSRIDKTALLLSILVFFICAWTSKQILENIPHLEDEFAYVWQANVIARGQQIVPSPPCPRCFLVPFVIDYNGLRFGKYPPGWPALLGVAVRLGIRNLINPFLAGFSIWLVYRLAKKLTDEKTALLTGFLAATSPMFLMNSASLLSHLWSFWLTLVFIITWFDSVDHKNINAVPRWLSIILSGCSLGLLTLTRPLTAVAIAIPFIFHGGYLLLQGSRTQKNSAIQIGFLAGAISLLLLLWQYSLTGNALLNPYQLWWPYDKLGFGADVGLQPGGYSWIFAKMNTRFSLRVGAIDLFGWFRYSWLFLPFGVIAIIKKPMKLWLVAAIFPSLVLTYTLYWIASWLFGPRYYFEALFSLALISALGIRFLIGDLVPQTSRTGKSINLLRFTLPSAILLFLITCSIFLYSPIRLGGMKQLYGASRTQIQPFQTQTMQEITPSLIIVHRQTHWIEYATFLELSSPFLDSPYLFTFSRGPEIDGTLAQFFPNRTIWHYYPNEPLKLYSRERPEPSTIPTVPMP